MKTFRQQWAGKDSEPCPTVASEAFPIGSGTRDPYVSSLPPASQLDGLGIGARRRMAEEFVTESLFIVDEGTRRRSVENEALKEQVQKELDEETVKLSRIQEHRRRAQQNDRLGDDLRRADWGKDFRSRSTTELPQLFPSGDAAYQPIHRSQHSEPMAPPSTSTKHRPSSNPPSSSTSRLLHGLQQQWWKTEEKRRRVEKEKERLRQQEELAREIRVLGDAWTVYESRWNLLNMTARSPTPMGHREQTSRVQLAFTDIPWPTIQPPRSKYDLTFATLSDFFLSRHLPAGRATKERLRDALLRWHPDRFEGRYLDKVRPQDREDVIEGVGIVVRYLNSILPTAE